MLARILAAFEPFVLALVGTVLLATVLPVRGGAVPLFDAVTTAGIVLLFSSTAQGFRARRFWTGRATGGCTCRCSPQPSCCFHCSGSA